MREMDRTAIQWNTSHVPRSDVSENCGPAVFLYDPESLPPPHVSAVIQKPRLRNLDPGILALTLATSRPRDVATRT